MTRSVKLSIPILLALQVLGCFVSNNALATESPDDRYLRRKLEKETINGSSSTNDHFVLGQRVVDHPGGGSKWNVNKDENSQNSIGGYANFEPSKSVLDKDNKEDGSQKSSSSSPESSFEVSQRKKDFHAHDVNQWESKPKSIAELMAVPSKNDVNNEKTNDTKKSSVRRPGRTTVRHLEVKTCEGGVEGRQYVVQCTHLEEEACRAELVEHNVEIINDLPDSDFFVVCVDTPEEKEKLLELAKIDDVEEDYVRTLKYIPEMIRPYIPQTDQNGRQLAQSVPYGVSLIDADSFWTSKNDKGSGAKVCVIDTGIRSDHEDFAGSTISGSNANSVVSPYNVDQSGHGTHVAGTVAAKDNGKGVVGVAPDAELFIVRVFSGSNSVFTASSLSAAMQECRAGGVDVVNMSLGGASSSSSERNKINQLVNDGIHVVAASGNSGNGANPVEYPASYDNVISVGAVDQNEDIAAFSSHNSQVDVAAPGVDIRSTTSQSRSSYAFYSGTSMASPHVAGALALLVSKYPNKSRSEVREALERTAVDVGACGPDRMFGNGLINVLDAAEYLDGSGSAAPEQSGCGSAKVTVKTDKWGSENSYVITNPSGEVVYKNGPYPNNREVSYVDEIELPSLPSGQCYTFEMRDSYGDGMCCENGEGFFRVDFNESEEFSETSFLNGGSRSETFGCGGTNNNPGPSPTPSPVTSPTPSPTRSPTRAPVPSPTPAPAVCGNGNVEAGEECDEGSDNDDNGSCTSQCKNAKCGDGFLQPGEECDDGNSDQGDGCSLDCKIETISTSCPAGQAQVDLFLRADSYSYSENELYFFEKTANPGDDIDEFIWIGTRRGIINNKKYELTECVDPTKCYRFFFFDTYGDGLFSEGLRLAWNTATQLVIERDEVGDTWEGGPAVFWMREVGNC